jgi:hypothetical protein
VAEFDAPTEPAFDAITRRTAQRVMITLNNGVVVGFPLSVLPGLEQATPDDLRKIDIEGGGYGLHIASLDADISVPQLLADQLGSPIMRRAVARATASQTNGRLGGRPRKPKAA